MCAGVRCFVIFVCVCVLAFVCVCVCPLPSEALFAQQVAAVAAPEPSDTELFVQCLRQSAAADDSKSAALTADAAIVSALQVCPCGVFGGGVLGLDCFAVV